MQTSVATTLRVIWIVMILIYTALVLTSSIAGLASMGFILLTMAVMAGETVLRKRLRDREKVSL